MPRKRRSYPAELKAKPIPILGGARLSGKVSNSVTVGVLNMQTESMGQTAANNFTVARVRQDLANRSSIGGLFVNRQATGSLAGIGAGRTSVTILEGDRSLFSPVSSPLVPRQRAQSANSLGKWRARQDSNLRPSA